MSYGFTKEAAEITCGNIAIKDTEWEVEKKTEKSSSFETEITEEEEETKVKRRKPKTTPAGGKAVQKEKSKARTIHTAPKAMQLPLFQPWRAFKSQHRLQTKLEKIVTAEEKFLTMEQLLKRAEYALAIKKKDANPLIVYAIAEEVWDQAIGMGKPLGTTDKGYPIVQWIRKGGQSIPIVMTEKGTMSEAEAIKSGAKAGGGGGGSQVSIKSMLGERAKQRMEAKGQIEISSPRTQREVAEEKGRESDRLNVGLQKLEKKTLEIKTPLQKHREFTEKREREAAASIERKEPITEEQLMHYAHLEAEAHYMENTPSFDIIGGDVMKNVDFKKLRPEDLWAHVKSDLNWTNAGIKEEYKQLHLDIGRNPYTTSEVRNVINQFEAIGNISNPHILHDFIVHTKNYYLKEAAMKRLASEDPTFFEHYIGDPTKPDKPLKNKTTYRIDKTKYNKQKKQYNEMKAQKEAYLSQQQKFFEEDKPAQYVKKQFKKTKTDKEAGKAHDPDSGYQTLQKMGLMEGGKLKSTPKITGEERLPEAIKIEKKIEQIKKLKLQTFKV